MENLQSYLQNYIIEGLSKGDKTFLQNAADKSGKDYKEVLKIWKEIVAGKIPKDVDNKYAYKRAILNKRIGLSK